MMESTLRLYNFLEKKLGNEKAREFAKVLEGVIQDIGELKKQEIKRVKDALRAEIRRLEAYMKIMVVLLLIAIALYSPIFAQLEGRSLKP